MIVEGKKAAKYYLGNKYVTKQKVNKKYKNLSKKQKEAKKENGRNRVSEISGYIKYFEDGRKNIFFKIQDDDIFCKYNEIWNKIKMTLNIKSHT